MGTAPFARIAGVAIAVGTLSVGTRAEAQSCCTATGSDEFGVVGRCHFAVIATQLGYDRGLGSVDASGEYRSLEHAVVDDVVLTLGAGIRLGTPALQLHGAIPLRLQRRDLEGLEPSTKLGPGDALLVVRAMVVEDLVAGIDVSEPSTLLPFVEPFVGLRAPTGRAAADSEDPAQADVMGEGGYTLLLGTALTKFVTLRHALTLSGSYGYRFAHDVAAPGGPARRFQPGHELDGKLGYVHVLDMFWSWTLFATYRGTSDVSYDGAVVPDSATRRLRFGVGVKRYLAYPTWQLSLSISADPPLDGFARNVPFAGGSLALGLQRNFTY